MTGKLKSAKSELEVKSELEAKLDLEAEDLMRMSIPDLVIDPVEQRVNQAEPPQAEQAQEESIRELILQLKQALTTVVQTDTGIDFSRRAFDWMACKPDKYYHPVSVHIPASDYY